MASSADNEIFETFKQKADEKAVAQRNKEVEERLRAQHLKQQQRISELLSENSTVPVTISEVRVLSTPFRKGTSPKTRSKFLERICSPLLSSSGGSPSTLLEARQGINRVAEQLRKLGIFQQPISAYVDKAEQTDASSSPTDLRVYFHAREGPWYTIKTGTEAGSAEGSVYGSAQFRNLFGGAESLNLHASRGTRTRSVYQAAFEAPVRGDPDLRVELHGVKSATLKPWASHEELQSGGGARVKYTTPDGLNRHEVGYGATWRQITGLAAGAAPAVRLAAGDSLKSALSWSWTRDARDNPLLPERGLLLRSAVELAGAGPLRGDVGFARVEAEAQGAVPVPLPRVAGPSGVAVNIGLRAGLLCPLPVGGGAAAVARPSILPDRFTLGGPTDVRGFRMAGLGPHEGGDALGGDAYAAGGASLLVPLPRTGRDVPLRLQAFVNAGRLVALGGAGGGGEPAMGKPGATWERLKRTVSDLRSELPSTAAGLGLVYAHPMARFELNFSLPLVVRRDEQARKGIQFGIGVTFL